MTQPDPEKDFRTAMNMPKRRGAALRALRGAPSWLILGLFSDLFKQASETNDFVGLARDAMMSLDRESLGGALDAHVHRLLMRDDLTWEEHQRVCELLVATEQPELLRMVMEQAAKSDDLDIFEVAEFYGD